MGKQLDFFSRGQAVDSKKYTSKVEAPIYEPKNEKPNIIELCDKYKTKMLIEEIKSSSVSDEEKEFLINAAYRHLVFNYEKIADYYANSSEETKRLMEKSALVIIDMEKAIELGYVKLCDDIKDQYLTEYAE